MATATQSPSYIILGAGVFGVSTAYHLIRRHPSASITLIDRDHYTADTRVAASWDWNKVVRADYDDLVYCRLGIEAQDVFKNDPLWKPYFHETGIWWTCRDDFAGGVIGNYGRLGRKADLRAVAVNEARGLFGGVFGEADMEGVKEVLVNKTSGWAAAGDCLQAVTRECVRLGVEYVVAEVVGLMMEGMRVKGVKTSSGNDFRADKVVLCTGAYTPKLLELSAEKSCVEELRVGNRILAGGITTGMTRLDQETYREYAAMPVGVQGYTTEQGPFIGSLPPTKDRELKWWGQTIFTNTREVVPGRRISAPPAEPQYGQWNVPKKLQADIAHANKVFYGKRGQDWKFEKYRICWDAFTSSGDFIISPHSGAEGLYVATCGNFHGWKFFPVIGKYVMQMLDGTMEKELKEKWAWDRERPDSKHFADYPRWEMNHVLDPSMRAARL